jgi:hypothetical protein
MNFNPTISLFFDFPPAKQVLRLLWRQGKTIEATISGINTASSRERDYSGKRDAE